jgi:RimJ/RimL family protein N-acetyltransferase
LEGLRYIEITTDPENIPSQRVIEANGGRLVERFTKPEQFGGTVGLCATVSLSMAAPDSAWTRRRHETPGSLLLRADELIQ